LVSKKGGRYSSHTVGEGCNDIYIGRDGDYCMMIWDIIMYTRTNDTDVANETVTMHVAVE